MIDIQRAISGVLLREGGFIDRKDDRGGATNRGITARTLGAWRNLGRPATAAEVRSMTEAEARAIYQMEYVQRPGLHAIPDQAVFELVLDAAVNHSPERAIKMLQVALGVPQDGILGPVTRSKLSGIRPGRVYRDVCAERIRVYGRLISGSHTDADADGMPDAAENAAGWLSRVAEFVERCP